MEESSRQCRAFLLPCKPRGDWQPLVSGGVVFKACCSQLKLQLSWWSAIRSTWNTHPYFRFCASAVHIVTPGGGKVQHSIRGIHFGTQDNVSHYKCVWALQQLDRVHAGAGPPRGSFVRGTWCHVPGTPLCLQDRWNTFVRSIWIHGLESLWISFCPTHPGGRGYYLRQFTHFDQYVGVCLLGDRYSAVTGSLVTRPNLFG